MAEAHKPAEAAFVQISNSRLGTSLVENEVAAFVQQPQLLPQVQGGNQQGPTQPPTPIPVGAIPLLNGLNLNDLIDRVRLARSRTAAAAFVQLPRIDHPAQSTLLRTDEPPVIAAETSLLQPLGPNIKRQIKEFTDDVLHWHNMMYIPLIALAGVVLLFTNMVNECPYVRNMSVMPRYVFGVAVLISFAMSVWHLGWVVTILIVCAALFVIDRLWG